MGASPRPPVTVTFTRIFYPAEMAERGRLGGIATAERHDPRETTKAGRAAFLSRFATDEERRAYFAALGRRSAEARRARSTDASTNGGA